MQIVIVDYGSGNLHSAFQAFKKASLDFKVSPEIIVSNNLKIISNADRLVLPGVGSFSDCKRGLEAVPGLIDVLHDSVINKARPFLGICIGMQLMATNGFENEITTGFDWIAGSVERIKPNNNASPGGSGTRIPHMGWNCLNIFRSHPILESIDHNPFFYFVHSYHLKCKKRYQIIASVDYGEEIVSIVGHETFVGTQFHPEKSQKLGIKLLSNFMKWNP